MTISSPGIGSGLDVNSIITQLMAIERQPITDLQTKAKAVQAQISEYGKLKSAMSTLRDAAQKLSDSTTWGVATGKSSDASAVAVTVGTGAAIGSYALQVQALAKAQSVASGVFASSAATPGAGTLRIELGSWDSGQTAFTPNGNSTPLDITVESTDTLQQIRDKINSAGAGVTASIVSDASGSRLLLRSTSTGVANAFRTTVTDDDGNNTDAAGLSALAFDPSSGANAMTQTEGAADAAATLNGLPITSASNTLTNLVDGVTLTLSKVTTTPVDINVVQDNDTLKKSIQTFVDAYNALNTLLAGELKYDAANKTAGPLQGDSTAVGIQRQLRSLLGASPGASSVFARLPDVGLQIQSDGSLNVSSDKLDAALTNLPELKKLFANTDPLDPSHNGIARQLRDLGSSLLGVDGSLTTRTEGLTHRVELNEDQQARLEARAEQTEKRLRAQYTALDATLGTLSSLSSYVTQQFGSSSS